MVFKGRVTEVKKAVREVLNKTSFSTILTALFVLAVGISSVFAFTSPSSGSFLYDMYDIVVEKMLKGPFGFTAGVGAMAFGAYSLLTGRILPAITAIVGGAILIKADSIAESLGLLF